MKRFEESKKKKKHKIVRKVDHEWTRENGPFEGVCGQLLSCVQLSASPWTVAHQSTLSMGFPRQEYWMDCHSLLHRIFATQGLNMDFLHGLYHWTTWEAHSFRCGEGKEENVTIFLVYPNKYVKEREEQGNEGYLQGNNDWMTMGFQDGQWVRRSHESGEGWWNTSRSMNLRSWWELKCWWRWGIGKMVVRVRELKLDDGSNFCSQRRTRVCCTSGIQTKSLFP